MGTIMSMIFYLSRLYHKTKEENVEMIKEIYQGDFRPADNIGMSEEYKEKRQTAYELGKKFMDRLEPAEKGELSKILEAHMEVLVAGMEEGYIAGFSDGIRLIVEALGR